VRRPANVHPRAIGAFQVAGALSHQEKEFALLLQAAYARSLGGSVMQTYAATVALQKYWTQ
jgi:hypothetical protein